MSLIVDIARLSAALNVVLLLALAYVWADSYRQVGSKHTLGVLMFSLLLLAENVLALYYYLTAISLPAAAIQAMMTLQILEMAGIALLVYVTWD